METVNYRTSFILFWGSALAFSLYAGGLLLFAVVCLMILFLHTHEYAHACACKKCGVEIKEVYFSAFGGGVDVVDISYASDAVKIYLAGLKDTTLWCSAFTVPLIALYLIRPIGFNFAMNTWLNFWNSIALFLTVMVVSNILPIVTHAKNGEPITTDGWAAIQWCEIRDECFERISINNYSESKIDY